MFPLNTLKHLKRVRRPLDLESTCEVILTIASPNMLENDTVPSHLIFSDKFSKGLSDLFHEELKCVNVCATNPLTSTQLEFSKRLWPTVSPKYAALLQLTFCLT